MYQLSSIANLHERSLCPKGIVYTTNGAFKDVHVFECNYCLLISLCRIIISLPAHEIRVIDFWMYYFYCTRTAKGSTRSYAPKRRSISSFPFLYMYLTRGHGGSNENTVINVGRALIRIFTN